MMFPHPLLSVSRAALGVEPLFDRRRWSSSSYARSTLKPSSTAELMMGRRKENGLRNGNPGPGLGVSIMGWRRRGVECLGEVWAEGREELGRRRTDGCCKL